MSKSISKATPTEKPIKQDIDKYRLRLFTLDEDSDDWIEAKNWVNNVA